jgi:hypothetical protein
LLLNTAKNGSARKPQDGVSRECRQKWRQKSCFLSVDSAARALQAVGTTMTNRTIIRGTAASLLALMASVSGCGSENTATPEETTVDTTQEALNPGQTAGVGTVSWEYAVDPNAADQTLAKPGYTYDILTNRLNDPNELIGHSVGITISVPTTQIDFPDSDLQRSPWNAVRAALNHNIPVSLFVTLPVFPASTFANQYTGSHDPSGDGYHGNALYKTTGYFANASNMTEYTAQSTRLIQKFQSKFPGKKATILVDLELRREVIGLYGTQDHSNAAAELTFFQRYGDLTKAGQTVNRVTEYNSGLTTLKNWVIATRATGWKVDVSSYVQMLDDYADGDSSLRRAYGVTLDDPRVAGGIQWSHAYFQAFTTLYGRSLPGLTSYFVYDFAGIAKRIYGAAASIDIGLTDGGIDPSAPIWSNWVPMGFDVSAALAAGIPRAQIEVYSYKGMTPIANWLIGIPPASPPFPDVQTPTFHATNAAADLYFPAQ